MKHLHKLLFAGVVAASGLGMTAAQAQPYGPPGPPPPGYHHWHHGDRYMARRHYVRNWGYYHLPPPPPGGVWVKDGPNFLLLDPGRVIIRVWGG